MSSYPQAPPPDAGHSSGPGAPPKSVRTAATLVYAIIAIAVLRTILTIVFQDSLIEAFAESQGINPEVAKETAPEYTSLAIIGLLIFGGLMAWLTVMFLKGRNWARIVATVIAVLNVLGGLIGLLQAAPLWYQLLGLLSAILAVGVIVMLWRRDSKEFFAPR